MFSITTIESSTTRPIAIVRAPRVSMFRECPPRFSPMKVTRTEIGIERAVTSVERTETRKTKITTTAKSRPSRPSVANPSMECSMNGAWSNTTVRSRPGTSPVSSAIASSTAWDTPTTSAPWVAVIDTDNARLPFMRVMEVGSWVTISRSATSSRCTTVSGWV